jgi:hypothetical protein
MSTRIFRILRTRRRLSFNAIGASSPMLLIKIEAVSFMISSSNIAPTTDLFDGGGRDGDECGYEISNTCLPLKSPCSTVKHQTGFCNGTPTRSATNRPPICSRTASRITRDEQQSPLNSRVLFKSRSVANYKPAGVKFK